VYVKSTSLLLKKHVINKVNNPIPAPITAGFLFALGLTIHLIVPVEGVPAALSRLGVILAIAGAALIGWAMMTMALSKTTILPWKTPASLVRKGPYRHSRNPMYAGLLVTFLGLALHINSLWLLAVMPAAWLLVKEGTVRREEHILRKHFKKEYDEYCALTPRWL
jgi:protein-S-isoprenylcysteine O-methyltransferase Ste14